MTKKRNIHKQVTAREAHSALKIVTQNVPPGKTLGPVKIMATFIRGQEAAIDAALGDNISEEYKATGKRYTYRPRDTLGRAVRDIGLKHADKNNGAEINRREVLYEMTGITIDENNEGFSYSACAPDGDFETKYSSFKNLDKMIGKVNQHIRDHYHS